MSASLQDADAFYDICDKDNDGKLSREELKAKMEEKGFDEERIATTFKYFDINGDGNVTQGEVRTALCASQLEIMFKRLDTDGSGELSPKEISGLLEDASGFEKDAFERFLSENDIDKDGSMDYKEFLKWFCGSYAGEQ